MDNIADRLLQLYNRRLNHELTEDESTELSELLKGEDVEKILSPAMLQVWRDQKERKISVGLSEVQIDKLMSKLFVNEEAVVARRAHRVHFLKTAWFRYAAAIIILFGIGAYLWSTQQKERPEIVQTKPVPVKNDIAPGTNRAVLTLSDGRKVELTSQTEVITDNGINIQNEKGRLEYGKAEQVVFNTMSTPRGGQYQLTLADGTRVWLNAASSITYPTAFTGNTREVTITGEAYFDIAKEKTKPFLVKTAKETIAVLGTEFNVNAYADEPGIKTSLIEGSVKVDNTILRPGQACINGKVVATNIEQDIAWKNGAFNFSAMDIGAVFRLLGRWYNVDIKYAGAIPSKKLRGEMGRDLTLSEVLKSLNGIGINTRIEGNTLVVLPD